MGLAEFRKEMEGKNEATSEMKAKLKVSRGKIRFKTLILM